MPSLRLYAFLSEVMQKLVSPYVYSHPYNKWFKEYSYESFKTKLDPKEERLMLFADFDFTCTCVTSLEILANIEILTELLSHQYTSENNNFIEKIMLGKKSFSFDYEGLYNSLVKLSSSEEQAVSRILDSGVLKGISSEDIKQAGKFMILQNGCMHFFEKVNNLDASVVVMSCWSGDLTRLALSGGLDMLKVDGNEFSYGDGIFTAKLKYFEDMVQENASEHGVGARTAFIGGSVNDLLCLLTTDIGIVIGSNKSLIKVGKHFGITFVLLFDGVVKEQKKHFKTGNPIVWTGGLSGTLYIVTSWIEIYTFILGCDLVNEEL
ncbi:hypothetical protein MKX03_022381 [Papaver bracteatum]|nr:hypothetical protein MKX03_022381 [Papaver bracteatum]